MTVSIGGRRNDANRNSHFLEDIYGSDEVHMWLDLFINFPSLQNVSGLHIKLEQADGEWMAHFLELDGLEAVLNMLYSLSYLRFNRAENKEKIDLDDAIIMLACINCLKAVMKNNKGLQYFCDGCDSDVTKQVLLSKSHFYVYCLYYCRCFHNFIVSETGDYGNYQDYTVRL